MTVTEAIKTILKEKDITQTELAEKVGTTRQNLNNKMQRDNFTAKELSQIAKALGITFIIKDNNIDYTIQYNE